MSKADDRDPDLILEAARQWREHGWDGGAKLLASFSVFRVNSLIHESSSRVLRKYKLTFARYEVLALLTFTRRGELPMGRIGKLLMLHPTSISSTVDGLERLGFVERVPHPSDGRATLARILPKGRKAVRASSPGLIETHFGLSALTDAEATQLFKLLKKVRDAAGG